MDTTDQSSVWSRFRTWLCIAAIFANFLMDTMIAPALPAMGETLNITQSQLGFVFTCGLLSSAIALPLGGRIADLYDRHVVLAAILALSLAGSACAALAHSFAMAALGQALLGTGSVLLPLGVAIATSRGGGEKSSAMVFVSSGVSALAGLLIGGYILERYPYQTLFWMVFALNAVLFALALVAMARSPSSRPEAAPGTRLDLGGGLVLGASLALFLYASSQLGREGISSPYTALPLVLSGALALVWWRFSLKTASPLIDPRQLLDPVVARFALIQLATGFNATAVLVAIPMIVTSAVADGGLGLSEAVSSYLFIPSSIVLFIAPVVTLPLRRAIGERGVVLTGSTLIAAGTGLLIVTHTVPALLVGTVLGSIGLGLLLTQTFDLLAVWIEADRVASVSGFVLVLKIIGAALGGQLAGNLMELLPPVTGFRTTILIATLVIVASLPAAMGLSRSAAARP